jgi:hypothetical protein
MISGPMPSPCATAMVTGVLGVFGIVIASLVRGKSSESIFIDSITIIEKFFTIFVESKVGISFARTITRQGGSFVKISCRP